MSKREQFVSLDGLRGVAALVVLAIHLSPAAERLLPSAFLAVDFFFGLSGFVLAHAYAERLKAGLGFVEFMTARYIRLAPLAALGTIVGLVVFVKSGAGPAASALALVSGLAFLPKPTSQPASTTLFPLNFPAWSLFHELAANALFAALGPRLTWPVLAAILTAGAAGILGAVVVLGDFANGATIATLPIGLARVAWSFFAGVAIYRARPLLPAISAPPWMCALVLLGMLATELELVWTFAGFPLLIFLAANARPHRWAAPAYAGLGVVSYGLYVLHMPIGQLLKQAGVAIDQPAVLAAYALALGAAVLALDRWYDRPARRMLRAAVRESHAKLFGKALAAP